MTNETNTTSGIISKVWSFCNTLRDDGVGYGDYLEQLTYLLFLKMADEFSKPPYNRKLPIPKEFAWENLTSKRGAELEVHYTTLLRELSRTKGILGQIFTKSQNKILLAVGVCWRVAPNQPVGILRQCREIGPKIELRTAFSASK